MSIVLSCPSCSTRYRANPQAIGANGRRVRCASCGYVWTAEAEQPADLPDLEPAAIEETPEPAIEEPKKPVEAYRQREAKKRHKLSVAAASGAWGGLMAACALLLLGSWVFRVDIVSAWPRASSAYAAIGSDVNPYGISVGELSVTHELDHGVPLLVVEGEIHNFDRRERDLPALRAILRDAQAQSLLEWSVTLDGGAVDAGERRAFRTIVSDPPPGTVEVEVLLADPITEHLEEAGYGEAVDEPATATGHAPETHH